MIGGFEGLAPPRRTPAGLAVRDGILTDTSLGLNMISGVSGILAASGTMRTGRVDRTSRSQANVFRLQVRVLGSSFPRRTDSNHRSAIEREIHIGLEPEVKWVRPDLNRSRQHPKLVGFLVSGKTGGPRAQTKLPHGPAGSSRMIEGLKTLPRSLVGRPRDRSAERQDFVDEFRA